MMLLAIALAGCSTTLSLPVLSSDGRLLEAPAGEGLVRSDQRPTADVPMPVGFVFVQSRSRQYLTQRGERVLNHLYQGRANQAHTADFYRQNTPLLGWQMVSEAKIDRTDVQRFTKKNEVLEIHIHESWNYTTVMAMIRTLH